MDKSRLWTLGAAVVIVAVVLLGYVLGVMPRLTEASAAREARVAVEAQNAAHEAELVELQKKFAGISALRLQAEELRTAVPAEADVDALIGQLDEIAAGSQVTITAITVTDALPYAPAVPEAPAVLPSTGEAAAAPDAAVPDATVPGAVVPGAEGAAAAASPLLTAANFVTVPITVTVDGDYEQVLDFIGGLQSGERLVLVTGFTTTEDAEAPAAIADLGADAAAPIIGGVTATITAYVYVVLDGTAVAAPVVP